MDSVESRASSIILGAVVVGIRGGISFECLRSGLYSKIDDMSHTSHIFFSNSECLQLILALGAIINCSYLKVLKHDGVIGYVIACDCEYSASNIEVIIGLNEQPAQILSRVNWLSEVYNI